MTVQLEMCVWLKTWRRRQRVEATRVDGKEGKGGSGDGELGVLIDRE